MSETLPPCTPSTPTPPNPVWLESIAQFLETRPAEGATAALPFNVHFLMIDKCNSKCIMCGGDYFRSDGKRRITLDSFKTIAGNLHLERFRSVTLAGGGDPLLNPDLIPIIQYMNAVYPSVGIMITTNGIACSPRRAKELLGSRLSYINFSINAATRASYYRMMQVDLFDRVVENARALVATKRERGLSTYTQFSIAINRLNIHELPTLVELTRDVGFNGINVFYTRFYPDRIRHLNIDTPESKLLDEHSLFFDQDLSDSYVEKARDLAKGYGITFLHEPLFRDPPSPKYCHWHEQELMVGFDGEVYPCGGAEVHMKEKVEGGEYNFGNALLEPLEKFWNGDAYRALRISSQRGSTCLVSECRNCANLQPIREKRAHIMEWEEVGEQAPRVRSKLPRGKEALVSVIVPTFNRPDLLLQTITSIRNQTMNDLEIIVVNDCGSDVETLLAPLRDTTPIVYARHARNRNLAAARNTGIALARGKYIAYLDDDDLYYPDHLETAVGYLESHGESVVYTFDPHPVAILAPDRQPPLLTPLKEKLRCIAVGGEDGEADVEHDGIWRGGQIVLRAQNLLTQPLAEHFGFASGMRQQKAKAIPAEVSDQVHRARISTHELTHRQ